MTPTVSESLSTRVGDALARAVREEGWQGVPAPVEIELPGNPEHGDYATNVALKSARTLRASSFLVGVTATS